MPDVFSVTETLDVTPHQYRVVEPDDGNSWLRLVANEYGRLRAECAFPIQNVKADGITVVDTTRVNELIRRACIPDRRAGNLDIVRSDFGETIGFMILESHYGTTFGYKSIRDRELIHLTGRGIDAVGFEDSDECTTIVLGETKVSDEQRSPPKVVDTNSDSLRNQHLAHLSDLATTKKKVFDIARRAPTPGLQELMLKAGVLLEMEHWEHLRLVVSCTLVRPKSKYNTTDFGSFRTTPSDYGRAIIRFVIVRIPVEVENAVTEWHRDYLRSN